MKTKQTLKRSIRFGLLILAIAVALEFSPFSPHVVAKTKYKTLHFDKVLKTKQDFAAGQFKNAKLNTTAQGAELGSASGSPGEYITPAVQAPFAANYVGVHWKNNLGGSNDQTPITVWIRTSADGQKWGAWQKTSVDVDEGRNAPKPEETFAALVGTGGAAYAQAKIDFTPSPKINPMLKTLTFTFLNSGPAAAQTTQTLSFLPNEKAVAASGGVIKTSVHGVTINVIPREAWGADEDYRFNPDGTESWPRSYHGVRKIIIHHTAVKASNGDTSLADNEATMRSMYYYQAVTEGWGDLGYNAVVDAAGDIFEGRYGAYTPTRSAPASANVMVLDVEGGHAAGYNSGTFGVAAMGDFDHYKVPTAQLDALENVVDYVTDQRGIYSEGASDFLNYDGGWFPGMNNVVGHRDVNATDCPGAYLYDDMNTIKADVKQTLDQWNVNLANFQATENGNAISGTSVGPGTLNFSWGSLSGATSYQYVLEREHGVTGSTDNNEPWQTAWLANNPLTQTTTATNVSVNTDTLEAGSNYIFYVRALAASGQPLSYVSSVNFETGSATGSASGVTPPTVTLAALANTTVSGTVTVNASVSDTATGAGLYAGNTLVAIAPAAPYDTFTWNTTGIPNGSYQLSAAATDADGNVSPSNAIDVTVDNADTTPPTVSITSPQNGVTVSGNVTVDTVASDNVGVTKVELYAGNTLVGTDTAAPYGFTWDTGSLANGAYVLSAKAYDAAGNVGTSAPVDVTVDNVADTTPPIVSIASPQDGATVSGNVAVDASATDNIGVTSFVLLIDGTQVATSTQGTLSYTWNTKNVAAGTHTITATAADAAGNTGTASVTVAVSSGGKTHGKN